VEKIAERPDDLSLRRGDISNIRMDTINESTMRHYFDALEILKLLHSPCQIYNVDETRVPLDSKAPNVIVQTGSKKYDTDPLGRKARLSFLHVLVHRGKYCHQ